MLTSCGARQETVQAKEAGAESPAAAAADPMEKHQKQVFAMDTVMILTAYGDHAEEGLDAAAERILALEADLDPESETGCVNALNAGAGSQVVLSRDGYNVMSTAMEFWAASEGALDPGMYPLSKAWGFIGGEYRVPEAAEI